MVSKDEGKYVIWPVYFDKTLSKVEGRRVSKKHAVEKPNIENIIKSAKSLGLNPVLEKDSAHPSKHWKQDGRILVDKKGPKSKLLVQICNRLG